MTRRLIALALAAGAAAAPGAALAQTAPARPAAQTRALITLWTNGTPAFGTFVPNENPAPRQRGVPPPPAIYTAEGGARLAANPLYDFVFLNLEGAFDAAAIRAIAAGLRAPGAVGPKALIVRIPSIADAGADTTRARVREAFDLGADGVTLPHVRGVEEARLALSFFREAGVHVWSRQNPSGDRIAMLMLEDPEAVAQAAAVADLPGYSVLACGIGSLTQALKGDRAGAEAGTQKILGETKRVKLVNMLTASEQDVAQRVQEGFLGLLGMGAPGDAMIAAGRTAARR